MATGGRRLRPRAIAEKKKPPPEVMPAFIVAGLPLSPAAGAEHLALDEAGKLETSSLECVRVISGAVPSASQPSIPSVKVIDTIPMPVIG